MRICLTWLKNGRDAAGRRRRGRRTGNKQFINGGLKSVEMPDSIMGRFYVTKNTDDDDTNSVKSRVSGFSHGALDAFRHVDSWILVRE